MFIKNYFYIFPHKLKLFWITNLRLWAKHDTPKVFPGSSEQAILTLASLSDVIATVYLKKIIINDHF